MNNSGYIRSLYIDLSGVSQYELAKDHHYSMEELGEMYYPFLPIYTINLIKSLKTYCNDAVINRVIKTTPLPFSISTVEELKDFIQKIQSGVDVSDDEYRETQISRYHRYLNSHYSFSK